MSRVVIFGGEGFLGTGLRRLLDKEGVQYVAPDSEEIDLTASGAPDLIRKVLRDGDKVVMIAALTSEHGEAVYLTEANISMAANMIAGMRGVDIGHFVYISSDSVYRRGDEPPFWEEITEKTPLAPDTLYGFMHACREQFFREYFPPQKLTILRPCAVYGMGDTHNAYGINGFVTEAKTAGTITLFGAGEEHRPAVHIDDMVAVMAMAARQKIAGVFNVNCGVSLSFKVMAERIAANAGKIIKIMSKPRNMPVTHRCFDNSALVSNFFAPRKIEEGVIQYLACLNG